jgi:hypothetical protein
VHSAIALLPTSQRLPVNLAGANGRIGGLYCGLPSTCSCQSRVAFSVSAISQGSPAARARPARADARLCQRHGACAPAAKRRRRAGELGDRSCERMISRTRPFCTPASSYNDSFLMDRRTQRLSGSSRVIRGADDGGFDREFWAAIHPARRLELVWDMALEWLAWRGGGDGEPRLQRSVCRVERRGS